MTEDQKPNLTLTKVLLTVFACVNIVVVSMICLVSILKKVDKTFTMNSIQREIENLSEQYDTDKDSLQKLIANQTSRIDSLNRKKKQAAVDDAALLEEAWKKYRLWRLGKSPEVTIRVKKYIIKNLQMRHIMEETKGVLSLIYKDGTILVNGKTHVLRDCIEDDILSYKEVNYLKLEEIGGNNRMFYREIEDAKDKLRVGRGRLKEVEWTYPNSKKELDGKLVETERLRPSEFLLHIQNFLRVEIIIVVCVLLFVAAIAFYFMPTLVAHNRKHNNIIAILLLNLFLGYTIIGWTGALIWAVIEEKREK